MSDSPSSFQRLKTLVFGGAHNLQDKTIYHRLALVAFLAWVGLGSDGLSSSCYGPQEAFKALGEHPHLGLFVALATAITIFVISASYSQIIELFPTGGGGYLVASKLLSPRVGAISGCALLVDYVLTIALSIASGSDALFSLPFVPPEWQHFKVHFAVVVLLCMTLLNIRGVRESVAPLVPIFIVFVLSHIFIIGYALATHMSGFGSLAHDTVADVRATRSSLGLFGMMMLMMHSYSMGAGTFTGIEAVSNGMPILREPKVRTAKRTMFYMAVSLALTAGGLMVAYLLYYQRIISPLEAGGSVRDLAELLKHKTMNALVLEQATSGWIPLLGKSFVIVTLISEGAILTIAAQTGFLDAPRVLAYMAVDRWFPTRLSMLSDRLVIQKGVLIMSAAAAILILATKGKVEYLVVLYSINVFITFSLSQSGMVRHWWLCRHETGHWIHRILINGLGLFLTVFILIWVTVAKFFEGGWVTLVVTGGLVTVALLIRRHYDRVAKDISKFDRLAESVFLAGRERQAAAKPVECDRNAKTAVLLVSGFNGLGLHSTQSVVRYFGNCFKNFVFIGVGLVDAGNFKGSSEVARLTEHVTCDTQRYVDLLRGEGYYAESYCPVGTDIADEVARLAPTITEKFPQSVFFAGQLIFAQESMFTRWLHNNLVFAVQKRLYRQGIPFVILPFKV